MILRAALGALALLCAPLAANAQSDAQDDVAAARVALEAWVAAYQSADYDAQWALTDPRIRRWHDRRRWRRAMTRAARVDGVLAEISIENSAPATAAQLPCTEQRHCYREGVQYVVFILRTRYGRAAPPQPEYAAMALSSEGWRFGGGTLLNRPLGETAVIMTEGDERLYAPDLNVLR
ncbi:MAG: hypothetical protein AB7J28_06830 [Hyphomonadaceae bacterium]